MSSEPKNTAEKLRARAESLLLESPDSIKSSALDDLKQMAHELAVHQAELELQNEELRNTQLMLQRTRDRFHTLYEQAPVGYVVLDSSGLIRQSNSTFRAMLNRPDADLTNLPFSQTITPEDAPVFLARFRTFFRNPAEKQIVVRMRRESGEPFQAAIEARPNDFIPSPDFAEPDGKSGLMVVISDFSAQHEAQHLIKQQYRDLQKVNQRAERLNAILRAIRNVNQLITHEEDRERLIKGACECLTEDLSYPTAWVTLISETGPNLVAASQDYFEIGFASLKNQLGRGEYPSCMRRALKTDQVLMVNNPRMECPECPASSQYEGRTGLIRRLSYGGKTFGVLTVAAPSEFADDAEEQSLFDEVAGDLAFALHKIEMSEQLSESRRRYREIFEGSRDGFVVLDPAGRVTDANQAFCAMLGYTLEELRRLPGLHAVTPEIWQHWEVEEIRTKRFLVQGYSGLYELEYIRKDGSAFPVELQFYAPQSSEGETGYYWGIARDITKRRQAEWSLREANRIISQSPAVAFLWKKWKGRDDWPIEYVSDNVRHLCGYKAQEFTSGRVGYATLIHPEDLEHVRRERLEFAKRDKEATFSHQPYRIVTAKGQTKWVDHRTTVRRDPEGRITHYQGIVVDISERKQAEEYIELQAQMLDQAPSSITVHDKHGHFWYANQKTLTLHGYASREEFLSLRLSDLDVPESQALMDERMGWINSEGETLFEASHYRKDGSQIPLEVFAKAIRWNGKPAILSIATDISERKKAALKLEEKQKELEQYFTFSLDLLCIARTDGRFLRLNPEWEKVLGYKVSQLQGGNLLEYVHPGDLKSTSQAIAKLDAQQTVINFVNRIRRRDGSYRWIEWRLKPQGENIYAAARDITDRRQAEYRLRNSEERFRTLFESLSAGSFICELVYEKEHAQDYRIVDLNPSFEKIMGLSRKDVINALGSEVFGMRRAPFVRIFERVDQTGEPANFEIFFKPINRHLEFTVSRPAMGKIATVFSDITERKKTEMDRNRLISAVEQAAEVIVITDAEGNIEYVNAAFEHITGYAIDEVTGHNPRILKSGRQDLAFYQELWNTITGGHTWQGRMTNKKRDGSFYVEDAVITPVLGQTGRIENFVAVNRDVTNEIQLEENLRQAHKMEAIGTLAGGIAHDFNNILAAITGFSELALEDAMAGKPTPDELKNIIDSAERAKSLIKKIMVFSRKAELAQKTLYLNELITNLITILERTLPKMISIRTELENGLLPINGDSSQIELVILNLAGNAQDAMPRGGTLLIKTGNVTIDEDSPHLQLAAEPGNYVLLTVSDTGIGMDKETLRHIFEPFYTTKEVGKGTGMGLASVYGAVKSHGGFITCASEPGAGTVFDCYLPAISRPRQVEKPAEPRMRKKLEGAETILLVDDEKNLRDLGGRMLNLSGYRVVKAESGEEAVEIYRQQGPELDLVLMDLSMPGIGGQKALEQIMELDPEAKIIVTSGYPINGYKDDVFKSGAVGYVAKPFRKADLFAAIRKVLDAKD